MNLDSALQTFVLESRELLQEMESALLAAEEAQGSEEMVHAVFRAAHTIKGSAGLYGLDHVVAFTHVVESLLDHVREGGVTIDGKLIALFLSCCDHIGALIDAVDRMGGAMLAEDDPLVQAGAPLLTQLRGYMSSSADGEKMAVAVGGREAEAVERIEGGDSDNDNWHISLRFGRDVLRNGMDPLSFLRYLRKLGAIVGIVTVADALPPAGEMDPESCYLGFEIAFKSTADKATIEGVFEFMGEDCSIRILPPNSWISEYLRLIHELPEGDGRLGEILVRCGTVTAQELEAALNAQAGASSPQPIGTILVEQGSVRQPVIDAALARQEQAKAAKAQENRSIRIDAEKLDHLINLIGELVIAGASTNLIARRAQNTELQESASTLLGLVEEVRDSALQLRMVKIGATFSRFQRVVHDVAKEIGKDIGLDINGADTELDKTVVEKIADPLTHLVRNAIDHGIEPAEIRTARGKPAKGTVTLNAYHDSGCIVIEVSDDGGGLKRDRILEKAIERGLAEPGSNLSDADIYNLIFEPGFSTAEKITNLSGRGVGMDVVKRNITALRGTIAINSQEGVGTTVIVRLPLTLAIIDGFLVGLGKSMFVVPLDMIEECVEYSAERGHDYTNLRGEVLPFIRLREIFDVGGPPARRESIVVVRYAGQKAGLVVDALHGEFQTVIKPLNKLFSQAKCISGSTILGSGEVALIVDVPALIQQTGDSLLAVSNQSTA